MQTINCLLMGFVLILGVTSTEGFARSGRRVCAAAMQNRAVSYVESHVQPVYQPYITTCQGHRLCSTYRTTYKVAYRQAYRSFSQPVYTCCPGWRRASAHAVRCSKAICRLPCQNGGSCSAPDRCTCPPGWRGNACQTGGSSDVQEEVQALRRRVEVLEQKLQLVLAPFQSFVPSALDDVSTDPISLLFHSLRQLDRIDSLSEQISFLEERLETCSCKNER
ncbi:epidermal growth factor-like protein 7 isoform X2 [Emydura macquarii macquarii]|uniref:epidermal growth factor-like protein 7 isoform X2 n=1 Tax=Emydura macquarii macquarii TaxID=1129001 RepID=UPI00352A40E2